MTKKIILLWLFLLGATLHVLAQNYNNSWIDYSKTYYKFKVAKNGLLHRINYNTLNANGLGSLAGNGFKLYAKGAEIPIYVSKTGTLSNGDYIEFYGENNTGEFDTQLYSDPDWQYNKGKSLFTDSLSYYLMWDNSTPSQRYEVTANSLLNAPAAEKFFIQNNTVYPYNQYNEGFSFKLGGIENRFAEFGNGECFGSLPIFAGNTTSYNVASNAIYNGLDAPLGQLEVGVGGQSDDFANNPDHHVEVYVNNQLFISNTYEGYNAQRMSVNIFLNSLTSPTTPIGIKSVGDISSTDKNAVLYLNLKYPHSFDFENKSDFTFTLANSNEQYLEITNFNAGTAPLLYDITNKLRMVPVIENGIYKFHLPAGNNPNAPRKLVFANTTGLNTVINVSKLKSRLFTNYSNLANQGDYIMISHSLLMAGQTNYVNEYAQYRASVQGGMHKVVLADIEQLYDQFAWGIDKHPLSIKNFVNMAKNTWAVEPQFLFLLGKSVSYNKTRFDSDAFGACLVPTYGYQPSDNLLGATEPDLPIPQIAVGRVSAQNSEQVRAYFEKIVEYESPLTCDRKSREWTKNVAHVLSAFYQSENTEFSSYLNTYKNIIEDTLIGANVVGTYVQQGTQVVSQPNFTQAFNDGLALVTMMGHSVGTTWNFDVKEPSQYTNEGKYPVMLNGSCYVGNIHQYGVNTMAEKFVWTDNAGAIAYMATVSFGFPVHLNEVMVEFYKQLAYKNYNTTIGECLQKALEYVYYNSTLNFNGTKMTLEEFTLEGDPGVKFISQFELPDYIVENSTEYPDVQILDPQTNTPLVGNPVNVGNLTQVKIKVKVTNMGLPANETINIKINRLFPNNSTTTVVNENIDAPISDTTLIFTVNINQPNSEGVNTFTIIIDQANVIAEFCEDNNQATISIQVPASQCGNNTPPTITTTLDANYCLNSNSVNLEATPEGGTFFIDGVALTSNVFNPQNVGLGQHTIQYAYSPNANCTLYDNQTVNITAAVSSDFSIVGALDGKVCKDAEIIVQPLENDPNATYNWNFGTAIATNLGNNSYSLKWSNAGNKAILLTVTSANGCVAPATSKTITVQNPLAAPVITCATSTISTVAFDWGAITGATGYLVSINNGSPITQNTTGYTAIGLTQGQQVTINVQAIGNNSCGNSNNATAVCTAQDCPLITPIINNLQSSYCQNALPVLLSATPTGGTFTINGNTVTTFDPAQYGANTIVTIQYSYSEGQCSYSALKEVSINQLPLPIIDTTKTKFCPSSSLELNLTNTIQFDSYQWNTGATTENITVTQPGIYTIEVENEFGCKAAASVNIQNFTVIPAQIIPEGETILCGDLDQVSLQAVGAQNASYIWAPQLSLSSSIIVNSPNTYSVTITDLNGCTSSASIEVTEGTLTPPAILFNGTTDINYALCIGEGSAQLSVEQPFASYLWSNGSNNQQINITAPGTYSVTVTNAAGCTASQQVTVAEASNLTPTIIAFNTQICSGGTSTIDLSIEFSDSYNSFSWSNDTNLSSTTINQSGTYSVIVTNALGCTGSASISITEAEVPAPNALSSLQAICNGETATLSTEATTTYDTYQWSNGANTSTTEVTQPGTYTVTVTLLGCTRTDSVQISSPTSPTVNFSTTDTKVCVGSTVSFLNFSTNAQNYTWTLSQNNQPVYTSTENEPTFTVTQPGEYTVSLSAKGVCGEDTQTKTVESYVVVSTQPNVEITSVLPDLCPAAEFILQAQTANSSELKWNSPQIPAFTASGATVTTNAPQNGGKYTYIVRAINGACSVSDSIEVTVLDFCELPNVITPNADGANDTWFIPQAQNNTDVEVEIYNRWGQLVYSTPNYNNSNGWNGTSNEGNDLPEATYYYIINLRDGTTPLAGPITLLR